MKPSIEVPAELVTIHEADPRTAPVGLVRNKALGRELHRDTPRTGGYVKCYVERTMTVQAVLWRLGKPLIASEPVLIGAGAEFRFGPCAIRYTLPKDPDSIVSLL